MPDNGSLSLVVGSNLSTCGLTPPPRGGENWLIHFIHYFSDPSFAAIRSVAEAVEKLSLSQRLDVESGQLLGCALPVLGDVSLPDFRGKDMQVLPID